MFVFVGLNNVVFVDARSMQCSRLDSPMHLQLNGDEASI